MTKRLYYLQIDGAADEMAYQDARKHMYRLGKLSASGKGTARCKNAGWVVLYSTAESVEQLRRNLGIIGWNDRVSWVLPADTVSGAVALSKQLPLFD